MKDWIKSYVKGQESILVDFPTKEVEEIIDTLKRANLEEKQIFVFGNGGSAASASHFITDLGKSVYGQNIKKFKCRALNESDAWMTAIGNDFSYEELFTKQLENFANTGDIIFVMSVSGNSPNILNAAQWSKKNNMKIIALTGNRETPLSTIADHFISIPDGHYGRVEDAHMFICHVLAYAFIENINTLKHPVPGNKNNS